MKPKTRSLLIGSLLVVVGIAVVIFNLQFTGGGFSTLWPAIVLVAGIVFFVAYFSTRKKKERLYLVVVAVFLLVASVLLFVLAFTTYQNIKALWPGFLLALGLGLLAAHIYGKKKGGFLAAALVLAAAALVLWIFMSLRSRYGLVIGVSLFITGVGLFTGGMMRER